MKRVLVHLPLAIIVLSGCLLFAYGPIAQLDHYHEFADQSYLFGISHAADVFSNIGFALVALWGMLKLWSARKNSALNAGRYGYSLFLIALLLTSLGSSYYHLAPDDIRLIWDRLPIALACAGLLAAVRAETHLRANRAMDAALLVIFAVFSVGWWAYTNQHGAGDLRPYLLLQGLPLLLIPLWQWIYGAQLADRLSFGAAILLYVVAKAAEVNDHQLLATLGIFSGHTLKHLLAVAASGVLVGRLVWRIRIANAPNK